MPLFSKPVPFAEAAQSQAVKTLLPTTFRSDQLRALGGDILRRAIFSARIANAQYLDQIAGLTTDALAGALDPATARLQLGKMAEMLDVDHADARLNLILDTNLQTAQGYGQMVQANDPDVVTAFPALELFRLEDREDPRDWEARWKQAAQAAGDGFAYAVLVDHGVMAALKESRVWEMLGSLFEDSLGNPYPPFAFRSGMWTRDVSYRAALDLGLLDRGETSAPMQLPDFNATLETKYEFRDTALRDELLQRGDVKFQDGVLMPA